MINEKHVLRYCAEDISKIENYDKAMADQTQTWDCHHKAEILPCGRYSINQLQKYGLYYNRPASELVFLPHSQHFSMHLEGNSYTKGRPLSDEHKQKLSKTLKGRVHGPLSDEHKRKLSLAKKGKKRKPFSFETRQKLSDARKGKHHSKEAKAKMSKRKSETNIGRVWTTDGISNKFVYPDQILEGWRLGRAFRHRKRKKQ